MHSGCFLIGVTGKGFSKEGDALLGSVSDNPYDVRTFVKRVSPEGKIGHIGTELVSTTEHTLEERGYFARLGETTRGVNDAGLAFTCAMVIEDENLEKPSDPTAFADVTEYLMNSCTSVDEAIEAFSSKKAINPAYSVLLADGEGNLAHLEVGNFGVEVKERYSRENPGMVLAVNCYLTQAFVNYNAPHTLITNQENNNAARRERGKRVVEEIGELDIASLGKLLSDHENQERDPMKNPVLEAWGYSICNHGTRKTQTYSHEDLPWGTVSAEIMQPSQKLFWYAYGWPCGQDPEYGDQLYQKNSWGKFLPFGFSGDVAGKVTHLTTPQGEFLNKKMKKAM